MHKFEDAKRSLRELVSATVFLPSKVGGLRQGIPDSSAEALSEAVADVVNRVAGTGAVVYPINRLKRGDVAATISATGTIEPLEVVDVGAQVAGRGVVHKPGEAVVVCPPLSISDEETDLLADALLAAYADAA